MNEKSQNYFQTMAKTRTTIKKRQNLFLCWWWLANWWWWIRCKRKKTVKMLHLLLARFYGRSAWFNSCKCWVCFFVSIFKGKLLLCCCLFAWLFVVVFFSLFIITIECHSLDFLPDRIDLDLLQNAHESTIDLHLAIDYI